VILGGAGDVTNFSQLKWFFWFKYRRRHQTPTERGSVLRTNENLAASGSAFDLLNNVN